MLLGNGNGTFQSATVYSTGINSIPSSIAVADVNGDGKLDLVTANGGNSTVSVLLNTTLLATRSAIGSGNLELFPNPAQGAFTLRLPTLGAERTAQLTLLNNLGQAVQTRILELRPGGTDAQVDVSTLAAGVYTLRMQAGSQAAAQQIVVE